MSIDTLRKYYLPRWQTSAASNTTIRIGEGAAVNSANGVTHGSTATYRELMETHRQITSELSQRTAREVLEARDQEEGRRNTSNLYDYSRYIQDEMIDVMRMAPPPPITISIDEADRNRITPRLSASALTSVISPSVRAAPNMGIGTSTVTTVTSSELYPTTRMSTSQYLEEASKEKSLTNQFKANPLLSDDTLKNLAESLRINTSLNLFGKTLEVSTKLEMVLSTGEVITCDVSTDSIDIGDLNE